MPRFPGTINRHLRLNSNEDGGKPEHWDGPDERGDDSDEFEEDVDDNETTFVKASRLSEPNVRKHTVTELLGILDSGFLELNPPYQRGVVWTKPHMSALISSLYENFYIPPIIFNTQQVDMSGDSSKKEDLRWKRVCVDGKQRLLSIRAFTRGEIPVSDAQGRRWYYTQSINPTNGKARTDRHLLSDSLKSAFRRKTFVCYEYADLTKNQEEDLFARVQRGVCLTPAEKFRATTGEWQAFADEIEAEFKDVIALCANKRASGWRLILACFNQVMEIHSTREYAPVLKVGVSNIERLLNSPELCKPPIKAQLRCIFLTFSMLVEEKPRTFSDNGYKTTKTFAPVEMVCIACLLALYPDRRHDLLHGDILYFRKEIRETNKDLKLNSATWRDGWRLIEKPNRTLQSSHGSRVERRGRDQLFENGQIRDIVDISSDSESITSQPLLPTQRSEQSQSVAPNSTLNNGTTLSLSEPVGTIDLTEVGLPGTNDTNCTEGPRKQARPESTTNSAPKTVGQAPISVPPSTRTSDDHVKTPKLLASALASRSSRRRRQRLDLDTSHASSARKRVRFSPSA